MKISHVYKILSALTLFAAYATFILIYITAFLSPTKQVICDINYFHETTFELPIFLLTIPGILNHFRHILYGDVNP